VVINITINYENIVTQWYIINMMISHMFHSASSLAPWILYSLLILTSVSFALITGLDQLAVPYLCFQKMNETISNCNKD
jgi:hypothetical protein